MMYLYDIYDIHVLDRKKFKKQKIKKELFSSFLVQLIMHKCPHRQRICTPCAYKLFCVFIFVVNIIIYV